MDLLSLGLPPLFGFVIGAATNALAIRMLFRPYREIRVLGLRIQGMIPRRKGEIAATVAGVVTTELLREERVAERLTGPEVRAALETLAVDLVLRHAERLAGSLRSDPQARRAAERLGAELIREAGRAADRWLASHRGRAVLRDWVEGLLRSTPERLFPGERALVARIVTGKLSQGLASPRLEGRIREILARLAVQWAGSRRPLRELLPPEAGAALGEAVDPLVPLLLARFEEALLAPANVERIKAAVRQGLIAYLRELRGGLVKNAVRRAALLARGRIFEEVDRIVDANLFRLRELVREEENRVRLRAGIAEALDRVLDRTPGELLSALPPDVLDALYAGAAAWIARRLRRPEVAEALAGAVERELERWFGRPLGEALSVADPGAAERWVGAAGSWAAEGGLARLADRAAGRLAAAALDAALERPGSPLPEPVAREAAVLALDHLMPVLAARVPEILRIVDVEGIVERQIRAFSPGEVERVILRVARRELRAITWWGGVLGALVGGFQSLLVLWGG